MGYLADSAKKVASSRLRAFELFAWFCEDDLTRIAEVCAEATVESGSILIREGQVGKDVYSAELPFGEGKLAAIACRASRLLDLKKDRLAQECSFCPRDSCRPSGSVRPRISKVSGKAS